MTTATMFYGLFLLGCTLLFQGDVYSAYRFASESWNTAVSLFISVIVKLSTFGKEA